MAKRESKLVEQVRAYGPFAELYARGLTPAEVKQELFDVLAPYSTNHEALSRYVVEFMVADAITLKSIQDYPRAMGLFREALSVHHEALRRDRRASLQAVVAYTGDINEGLSAFWSQFHLARSLDELALEECVHECLRLIGNVIEGPFKPHVYELAHQARIASTRQTTVEDIRAMSIGGLIQELVSLSTDPQCYEMRGFRLSQWRNVAQHLSARVEGEIVVCAFGEGRSIRLTRDELEDLCADVLSRLKAIKVARSIVVFDVLDEIKAEGLAETSVQRPEASLLVLISGLASQGFEVIDAHFDANESRLVLRDTSLLDPAQRRVHSTQFVIPLFHERPAERVVVEYRERDGTPSLRTTATRDTIERAKRAGDWTLVARELRAIDLKV